MKSRRKLLAENLTLRDQLAATGHQSRASIRRHVETLKGRLKERDAVIATQQARIKELEGVAQPVKEEGTA